MLGAHDPRFHLLGVSSVHGNAALDRTTFNSLAILEAIGKRDVKVYPGAAKPIQRDAVHAADIHAESGLGGATLLPEPKQPAATDVDFLEAMYKALISTPPNTAWLVATGALTNVGLLFQRYPDLAAHLKGLSIMGGAVGGGFTDAPLGHIKGQGECFGNWSPYAEFNVSNQTISLDKNQLFSAFTNIALPDLRKNPPKPQSSPPTTQLTNKPQVRPGSRRLHLLTPHPKTKNNTHPPRPQPPRPRDPKSPAHAPLRHLQLHPHHHHHHPIRSARPLHANPLLLRQHLRRGLLHHRRPALTRPPRRISDLRSRDLRR